MPTWLKKSSVKDRYLSSTPNSKAKDQRISCWQKDGRIPPASYPVGPRTPMWPEEVLDVWDIASEDERRLILDGWPNWQRALATIAERRAAIVEHPEPAPTRPRSRPRRAAERVT